MEVAEVDTEWTGERRGEDGDAQQQPFVLLSAFPCPSPTLDPAPADELPAAEPAAESMRRALMSLWVCSVSGLRL
jgi:hypothetical protein